ncbi:MAG: hypothetical protein ABI539_10150 [Acidobacteriota bacterium]
MLRLALAFALAFTVTSQAQTYSVPRKLPLERAVKREFREWMITPARYPGLVAEQFFPIGWSRDGKFAYYYEPVDEACGCYFANLVIQDMRTDKVLWEFKFNADKETDPNTGKIPPEDNIQKLWKKNAKLFSEKLREHGIVGSRSVLLGKTLAAGGRSYTARGTVKMGKNPDYGDERVNKFTFLLTSPRLGTKTLSTIDHSKEEYWYTLDAGILGLIKSPFESRVAVIGMEVNRGWEGPPHNGDIRIVGADLMSGFARAR